MWNLRITAFVCCLILLSGAYALPAVKQENESIAADTVKPKPVILEAIEIPSDNKPAAEDAKPLEEQPIEPPKPTEPLKPTEPQSIDVKPTEETKPSDPISMLHVHNNTSGSTTTFITALPLGLTPPRRQIHYDQRQDGKYNIRADLENFVILVVPSSGSSLLDLLKRSNPQTQHHKRTSHTKHHKKYYAGSGKPVDATSKKSANRLDYLRPESTDLIDTPVGGEFIEGRTPYHVDISSSEIIQPSSFDRAAENVRSNLPTAVRSLLLDPVSIADIPLQREPDVDSKTPAEAATPATSSSPVNPTVYLAAVKGKQYNAPIYTQQMRSMADAYPRHRKSLTIIDGYGNSFSNFNSVLLTHNRNDKQQHANVNDNTNQHPNNNKNNNKIQIAIGNGMDTSETQFARPEYIDLTDTSNSFDSLNVGNIDRLALVGDTQRTGDAENAQWELSLLGAEEQCGPDRRRDSYGVCQFVPQDYATKILT